MIIVNRRFLVILIDVRSLTSFAARSARQAGHCVKKSNDGSA